MIEIHTNYPLSKAVSIFEHTDVKVYGTVVIFFKRWGICFMRKATQQKGGRDENLH